MSTAPNPAWPPPASSAASPLLAQRPPSIGWRIGHSLWLLLPILGFGCFGGAAFIYVGLRARRPSWWIAGLVYLAVGITAIVFVDEPDQETTIGNWAIGVWMAAWLASVLHACLINGDWLRFLANRTPWYEQLLAPSLRAGPPPTSPAAWTPTAPPAGPPAWTPPAPPAWTPPAPGFIPDPGGYYGSGPAATLSTPSVTVPPAGGGVVDINTATAEQLSALPGFDPARASSVLAERQERRGFGSVEEFMFVARLAPHELVRVRPMLYCGPRQRPMPAPGPGRVLDV